MSDELAVLKQNLTAEVVMRDVRIGKLTRAYEGQKAEAVWRGKLLIRLREQMILIRDGIDEDAPDRTYFASTNDADTFKEIVESLDDYKWDRILAEKDEPDILEKCRAANLRAETAEAEIAALKHDLSRHLSITSEQATEILGKDKEIAELKATHPRFAVSSADYHQRCGKAPSDAIAALLDIRAICDGYMLDDDYDSNMNKVKAIVYGEAATSAFSVVADQSVLLKKAEAALEMAANRLDLLSDAEFGDSDHPVATAYVAANARAVLSELQLKGK